MYINYFKSRYIRSAIFFATVAYCNITAARTTIVSYDFEDTTGSF